VFAGVDLAIDRGSRVVVLGLNGAGKTTLLRLLGSMEPADSGQVEPGHGLVLGYYAQEHETLDHQASVWDNIRHAAPDTAEQQLRTLLGAFLFTGEQLDQSAGTLSGGEKTRLALAGLVSSRANVLLLDEPTNNLDPASREQVLDALRTYAGAIVLVTHDEGAVRALNPDKVILLPDGTEDAWSEDLADLVELA
jgi:ATPase subunit of ABC transporter with duplicated ATPase domains